MNPKNNVIKALAVPNANPELLLYEHLALKRLRRLEIKRLRNLLWNAALNLVRPVRLVREVAPNERPLERHEWDHKHEYWLIR